MGPMKKLAIKNQTMLLSVVSLIGFTLIAAIYLTSSSTISDLRHDLINATESKTLTDEIRYDFLNARRSEKDFLIRLNDKYAKRHATQSAETLENIEKLKTLHDEPEFAAAVDEISAGYKAYVKQFETVVHDWQIIGLNEKSGLRGELRKAVHGVETKLKELKNDELTVIMLMMRRHEKDFFLRLDEKYVKRMPKREAEFNAALAKSDIPSDAQAEITKLMGLYQSKFAELAKIRLQTVKDIKQLSKLFAAAQPKFVLLLEDSSEELTTAISETESKSNSTTVLMIIVILAVAVVAMILAYLIGRGIATPISSMTHAMTTLAEGDDSVEIPGEDYRNELGDMRTAVQVFKDNMIKNREMVSAQEARVAEREKRTAQIAERTKVFNTQSSDFLSAVSDSADGMRVTANEMSSMADGTSQQASAGASASEVASANVQTVASAAEELSATISEISGQVVQANNIANEAVSNVDGANNQVKGLAEAAQRIGEVVAMITDIAEQTNLLALNATIEAARAGEAGKGFAVVASEVKNLANQTAKATDEISGQVTDIQNATQNTVEAIEGIGKTVGEVSEISSAIAAAVEEQGAATQEIARNVEQAAQGTQEVNTNISGIQTSAQQSGSKSMEVVDAANKLNEDSVSLKKEIEGFISDIKAIGG
jgi:methyl-accepting chemotaxis protein